MDDMAAKITEMLQDPGTMEQLSGLAGMLGQSAPESPPAGERPAAEPVSAPAIPPEALNMLMGMLGGGGNNNAAHAEKPSPRSGHPHAESPPAVPSVSPEALKMVMKMAPLFSQMNQENDSTRFLHALRPLLSPERQPKVDEAIRMLQMARLLPLLRQQGIF